MSVVGVSGSLTTVSRTTTLVEAVATSIADQLQQGAALIHVADHGAALGGIVNPKDLPAEIGALYAQLLAADIVVVGTPVYKASYTGLLKHFFDLVDPRDFRNKLVVLAATGGSDQHALVIEHQLRPLFGFFGALTVPTGVYLKDSDFAKREDGGYSLNSPEALQRIEQAVAQAVRLAATH